LEAVVRGHAYKLSGITNGIDNAAWDPSTDPDLPAHYDVKKIAGKKTCRDKLRIETGLLPEKKACVVSVVSRLVEQKGIDLIIETVEPYILSGRMQLVVLGSGDAGLEYRLKQLQEKHPGWVYVWYGYNETLAHRIIAGSDLFLMPSRTEPCGLTQLYSLRYGTLPLVRHTGGLADTVRDVASGEGNGFDFGPVDVGHFSSVLDRALGLFEHFPAQWKTAMQRGMKADNSWETVAKQYEELYQSMSVVV
jgi:starch synthase